MHCPQNKVSEMQMGNSRENGSSKSSRANDSSENAKDARKINYFLVKTAFNSSGWFFSRKPKK